MRSSLTLLRSFKNPKSLCSQPQRRNKFISSGYPISHNRDPNTDFSEKITSDTHFLQNSTINLTQTNVVNTLLSYKNDPISALRYFNRVEQKPGFVKGLDSFCVLLHILMKNSKTHGHARHLLNHWVSGYPGPTSIVLVDHLIECAKRFDFDFDSRVFNCLMDSYVKANKINDALDCCSGKFSGNSQNFSSGYGETSGSEYQKSLAGQDGKCRQNHGDFQLKPSRNYVYRLRGFGRNSNQFYTYHQTRNLSGYNWSNNGYPQQNYNGSQAQQSWDGQSNVSGFFGGNANMQNQYGSFLDGIGEMRQNLHGFNSQRSSESQGSINGSYMQNAVQDQQTSSDYYTGNVGIYHNGPSTYQQDRNAGEHHWDQSLGPYQQNPIVASKVLTNTKPEEESSEASECSQNNGTLEELDSFVKEGKVKEAVEVLGLLEKQCLPVHLPRLIQLMQACEEAKALEEAKAVHEHILRSLSPLKVSTHNRILRMYSECGSMDDAFNVFNNMGQRNLTSWDTMITGLAKNGLGEDAVDLFSQFKQAGLKPDGQMFIGVFSACSVLGDIDEGMLHFKSMIKDYGIIPSMKHYVSIVDMLGSAGYLDEALEFIEKMPMEPSADVWETLMNLCRIHGNIELGDRCAELVEQLDPSRLNEKSKAGLIPVSASDLAKEKEKKKLASQNLLEVRSRVHEYRAGDTSHPETDKIYALIRGLKAQMKESGYTPETRFVLHDIDQEGKEEALLAHSERLAVSHGLLSSPARAPVRIIKNLRVCGDCHTALKIISKIVGRELIIRDAKRFHHFKDGLCSCRDYW